MLSARTNLPAAAIVVALVAAGCAASSALHKGRDAEFRRDYDRAVVEYTTAVRLKPEDPDARQGLERAKVRASEDHLQRARRLAAVGKLDQALVEYGVAAELNPTSTTIDDELTATRNQLRVKVAVSREGKTQLESLIDRTRDLPPPGLDLPPNVKMPASLTFRDASSRDVFTTIARFAGISLVFDTQFREAPITVDLRNATLDDALTTVAGATRSFFRVSAPQTVVVIPDTPAKRREYEEEIVRTFYLSNADLKETMDLLRLVLDARRISPITATNAHHDQGHARAHRGRRPGADGYRQGAAGSHHRRGAAGSRSQEAPRVRPADRHAGIARIERGGDDRPRRS